MGSQKMHESNDPSLCRKKQHVPGYKYPAGTHFSRVNKRQTREILCITNDQHSSYQQNHAQTHEDVEITPPPSSVTLGNLNPHQHPTKSRNRKNCEVWPDPPERMPSNKSRTRLQIILPKRDPPRVVPRNQCLRIEKEIRHPRLLDLTYSPSGFRFGDERTLRI